VPTLAWQRFVRRSKEPAAIAAQCNYEIAKLWNPHKTTNLRTQTYGEPGTCTTAVIAIST
jgi:hypothetical protein